jgi:hypothetical protein
MGAPENRMRPFVIKLGLEIFPSLAVLRSRINPAFLPEITLLFVEKHFDNIDRNRKDDC